MRPIRWGLTAALVVAVLAPVAVFSAPRVSDAARKQGMQQAPAAVQAAGLTCTMTDARFVGRASDPKAKQDADYYEVACSEGMGYVLDTPKNAKPTVMSCLELAPPPGKSASEGSLSCLLPANADTKSQLNGLVTKAHVGCTPDKTRYIGATDTNTFIEVACQGGGAGYVLVASAPLDPAKDVQAQNCLNFDDQPGALKCTLTDKAARLGVVNTIAQSANNGCAVKNSRFIGSSKDGAHFFEAACQDGKGYIYKTSGGQLSQTWGCGQAQGILGGCTLTDARQALAEQAGLYTKLAHEAGSTCDVAQYAEFPMRGKLEAVELACKDGKGGVGLFPATGKGQVLDCGHAMALGYKCSLTKDTGYASLTADLKKFGKSSCTVSNARLSGKTTKGTVMVEVACADGFKGYMIEYNTEPAVNAISAGGCAFTGGCQLPGNT